MTTEIWPAHAYFGRRIFSKSFGGKIRHIWTDVTYRKDNEICARIFLSFFGGKLKTFKQSITRVKLTKNYLLSFRIKSSSLSNRSQIWPFIFLREKHLICFVPLSKSFLSPVNKSSSCLIRDWSISDIHQSVCKKKKINNKSTKAMDLIEYNSCG